MKQLPRSCIVQSHQFHLEGVCWAITSEGIAIVEGVNGEVNRYDLTKYHSIKFTDADVRGTEG